MAFSFNINDFTSVIAKRGGLQASNRYSVYITSRGGDYKGVESDIPFLCEDVSLPGRSIATADFKTYGPVIKVGRESIYADLNLTFILTEDMAIKTYFDKWMNSVQNDTSYDPGYYRDYVGQIYIAALSQNTSARLPNVNYQLLNYAAMVEDGFPTAIADVPFSHGSNNTYAKLQVTFTYRRCVNRELFESS